MKYLAINEDLANTVLQYLSLKPYIEVGGMIDALKVMPLVVQAGANNEAAASEEVKPEEAITPEIVDAGTEVQQG